MASSRPGTEITLNLRRIFKAPRKRVFRSWTDPEELKKWWGPEGYATPSAEVDLLCGPKLKRQPRSNRTVRGESPRRGGGRPLS